MAAHFYLNWLKRALKKREYNLKRLILLDVLIDKTLKPIFKKCGIVNKLSALNLNN